MSQPVQIFVGNETANDAARLHLSGREAENPAGQNGAGPNRIGTPVSDAERIVDELVNQFFRCSTTMSGAFLCW